MNAPSIYFKWIDNDFIFFINMQGRGQTFPNEGGGKGGVRDEQGAAWDPKWRLSIDLCTKCNFIWGARGAEFLPDGTTITFAYGGGKKNKLCDKHFLFQTDFYW